MKHHEDMVKDAIRNWLRSKMKEGKDLSESSVEAIYSNICNKKPKWVGLADDTKPFSEIAEDIEFEMI